MGDVQTLQVKAIPREHITVQVEEFTAKLGEQLADAETMGARMAMLSVGAAPDKHMDVLETLETTRGIRSRQYAAIIQAAMRGIAK